MVISDGLPESPERPLGHFIADNSRHGRYQKAEKIAADELIGEVLEVTRLYSPREGLIS